MKRKKILGGNFDPVHNDHVRVARDVNKHGEGVVLIPCGPRPDKCTVKRINPVHRAAMLQLAFAGMLGVEFDFSDLEKKNFTPTWMLDQLYRNRGYEPVHVIGSDLLYGKGGIRNWMHGSDLWANAHFLVYPREHYPIVRNDLPVHIEFAALELRASSTQVRDLIYLAQDSQERVRVLRELVPDEVADYIEVHQLYTGMIDRSIVTYSHPQPKIFAVGNPFRPNSLTAAEQICNVTTPQIADIIVVNGGDGTMLRAQHDLWKYRKPFFGINFGTVGFLMNNVQNRLDDSQLFTNLELANCPMLHVTAMLGNGEVKEALAFSDAWVEADIGDMAEFDILVNGEKKVHFSGFIGLVATPAGSTGYHLNIAKSALPVGTPALGLTTGLGIPIYWPGARVDDNSEIEFVNTQPQRRLLYGFADGKNAHNFGPVLRLKVRKSNVAAVQLLKVEDDFSRKLNQRLFEER